MTVLLCSAGNGSSIFEVLFLQSIAKFTDLRCGENCYVTSFISFIPLISMKNCNRIITSSPVFLDLVYNNWQSLGFPVAYEYSLFSSQLSADCLWQQFDVNFLSVGIVGQNFVINSWTAPANMVLFVVKKDTVV